MERSKQTPHDNPQEMIEQPDNIEDYTIKVLNGLFECQIHSALSKVVNPSQAWKCSACKRFPYDLVCCIGQLCNNYYCRQCIDQQGPPPCHPAIFKGPYYRELTKQELSQIDSTLLSGCTALGCPNQRKEMSLFQLKNHLSSECYSAQTQCPAGCFEMVKRNDTSKHFKVCPNINIQCEGCQGVYKRFVNHDCNAFLKSNVDRLKHELDAQKALTQQKVDNIEELNEMLEEASNVVRYITKDILKVRDQLKESEANAKILSEKISNNSIAYQEDIEELNRKHQLDKEHLTKSLKHQYSEECETIRRELQEEYNQKLATELLAYETISNKKIDLIKQAASQEIEKLKETHKQQIDQMTLDSNLKYEKFMQEFDNGQQEILRLNHVQAVLRATIELMKREKEEQTDIIRGQLKDAQIEVMKGKQLQEQMAVKHEAELQEMKMQCIHVSENLIIKDTIISELSNLVNNLRAQIDEQNNLQVKSQVKGRKVQTVTLQREIQLQDSYSSLRFIVTKNDTVYAGDYGHDCLIVLGKQSSKPTLIPLKNKPLSGVITGGESILAIGCYGSLLMLSLKDELNPVITATIQLSSHIQSICKMSESHLLCGQAYGHIHVVDDKQQVIQFQAPDKKTILEIVKTCNEYACATQKGLFIVKATNDSIQLVSTHRLSDDISCIGYVKDNIVLLGLWRKNLIEVFDYGSNTTLKSIPNPSGHDRPRRIQKLSDSSFILKDDIAISIINIESESAVIYQNRNGWTGIQIKMVDANNITIYTNEVIDDKRKLKELTVTFE